MRVRERVEDGQTAPHNDGLVWASGAKKQNRGKQREDNILSTPTGLIGNMGTCGANPQSESFADDFSSQWCTHRASAEGIKR